MGMGQNLWNYRKTHHPPAKKLGKPSGYCLGFGLSYTSYSYSELSTAAAGSTVEVTVQAWHHSEVMEKMGVLLKFDRNWRRKTHETNHGFDWMKITGISRHLWYVEPLVWWANTIQVKVTRLGGERYIYIYTHTCYMVSWSFSICIWCLQDCRGTHI